MFVQLLNSTIVSMSATQSGAGYWLFSSDGGVFNFGDAPNLGSLRETPLDQPIDSGVGFWTVRSGGESGLNPACVARASQADGA